MNRKLLFIALTICLFLSACNGSAPNVNLSSETESRDDVHIPDAVDQTIFSQLSELFETFANNSADLWTSDYRFDLDQAMYVRMDAEENLLYAYIFNYKDAELLPSAKLVDTGFENLGDVYYLSEIPNESRVESIPFFDFNFPVGEEEIFMMKYSEFDEHMPLDSYQWQLFVAHEAMHRYQILHWSDRKGYSEGNYNFDSNNIALILLEQELLLSAINTEDEAARDLALKQFIAVRQQRNQEWPETIGVDNQQERGEGMPRYLEYRLAIVNEKEDALEKSIKSEIRINLSPMEGMIREGLGFGRFYSTGAALGYLLDELGIDWKSRIESGETPIDILSTYYANENSTDLIDTAKSEYDFPKLMTRAKEAAKMVLSEPEGELGSGGATKVESIRKPYEVANPAYTPSYLPDGYNVLGMFKYAVSEIDFPPIAAIYSPTGEDVIVVDLGNDTGTETEIRISRSKYQGNLDEYFNSLGIGMPPMEDLIVENHPARGFSFDNPEGQVSMLTVATGEELIHIEGPISLEEAVEILESLIP